MSKPRTVPAFALSRILAADSSVIGEGKVGRLPPAEFEALKGLGAVREPTKDELEAADAAPADPEPEAAPSIDGKAS